MPVKITCETEKGGAVRLNEKHGVWASYAVAKVGDLPASELLYAAIDLSKRLTLQLFVNRETGLVVLETIDTARNQGVELFRRVVDAKTPGANWVGESLESVRVPDSG